MSMRDQETPEFSFSLRGYDRVQVDEYVAELLAYVIEVEERAATAESALVECRRELASPGSAGISERLAAILALANEEADQIRARAQAEGAAMTQQAASVAERTVAGAHRQRDAVQQEIDGLTATREVLFQRLVELGNEIRDATVRYQEYVPGAAAPAQVDVELFDAEAIEEVAGEEVAREAEASEGEAIEEGVAVDEPVADPEADTIMVTSTGKTPDPS
jgi:cell division septum initiation protein DivIVA